MMIREQKNAIKSKCYVEEFQVSIESKIWREEKFGSRMFKNLYNSVMIWYLYDMLIILKKLIKLG